ARTPAHGRDAAPHPARGPGLLVRRHRDAVFQLWVPRRAGLSAPVDVLDLARDGRVVDHRPADGAPALRMKNLMRELRTRRGGVQTDLGEALTGSRPPINAIENERYDPSLPLAFAIARVFELKIE